MTREGDTTRVLSPSEEYGIAVYYVCGVPIKWISEVFNVSRSGVNRVVTRLGVGADRGKAAKRDER